jgi:hypothetical protein
LAAAAFAFTALLMPTWVDAQEAGRISGRVVDADSGAPVASVVVQVFGLSPVVSDENGSFLVEGVPPGPNRVTFEHLAYGTYVRTIDVESGGEAAFHIAIAPRALELAPLVVEATSELEERRITSGFSINEIGADRIDRAAQAGLDLAELIETALPGVETRAGMGNAVCVTYRPIRSGNSTGGCDGVEVRLDGVPISDPAYIYRALPLRDIERIEIMSPAQAGAQYGMRTGQGILLIETKEATAALTSDRSRYLTGWSWEEESEPYPWLRVLGSSALVTAATVGLSLALADSCFRTPEDKPLALRTECGPLSTAGASIGSVVLPSVGGGLAARWAGSTERSRGRLVPSMVTSSIALVGGYLMMLGGDGGTEAAGAVLLFVGVPLTQTLADRVMRILR